MHMAWALVRTVEHRIGNAFLILYRQIGLQNPFVSITITDTLLTNFIAHALTHAHSAITCTRDICSSRIIIVAAPPPATRRAILLQTPVLYSCNTVLHN